VTDQAFWEKRGVVTGEDLALSVLGQTYSDLYKDIHGFRPRGAALQSVEEYTTAINDLDEYYASMIEQDEIDVARQAQIDKERAELSALMPGKFDFEQLPKTSGMGRRMENKMIITKKRLTRIIREAILSEAEGDLSNAELAKELKGGASDIASAVPAKLNDELARIIQTLTAMAQFDKAKFEKMVGYADNLGAKALEKAQKGEKPEESEKA
jgi:ribosome-binding protein aMBF1 (putative translation factor)